MDDRNRKRRAIKTQVAASTIAIEIEALSKKLNKLANIANTEQEKMGGYLAKTGDLSVPKVTRRKRNKKSTGLLTKVGLAVILLLHFIGVNGAPKVGRLCSRLNDYKGNNIWVLSAKNMNIEDKLTYTHITDISERNLKDLNPSHSDVPSQL